MASEQFSLCWDNFHKNMSSGMHSLLANEDLVDVTLAVEGKCIKAHKMVLSVCSPYFKELFKSNPCQHPIVFMKDVSFESLHDLLQFMYQGEVQVSQENLTTFIKTAEALQIKGLTGDGNAANDSETVESPERPLSQPRVEEFKPATLAVPRTRKQPLQTSPAATTPHSLKRQRLSQSSESSQIPTPPVTKTEPISTQSIPTEPVHFKVEPFEQSHSIIDDAGDDNFGDEQEDSHTIEDTEDYSMMEGTADDQQASTSTDGAGEGQDMITESLQTVRRKANMPRYVIDGFVFHVNITKGNPQMVYLRCLEYKRLGCHARAIIPYDGTVQDIKVNKPHNHPPDFAAEEKIVFIRELREVMLKNPTVPSRTVYAALSEMYPIAACEIPFDNIRHKMNRWRRQQDYWA